MNERSNKNNIVSIINLNWSKHTYLGKVIDNICNIK